MDRAVELFVAAYEERSFTAAAEREGATQSGVSQHIRKIENRFAVRLFERSHGRVTPTPAADQYYRRCVEQLMLDEKAKAELLRFAGGATGQLTVGLMPTISTRVLAPALLAFTAAHPNARVNVVEGFSGTLTDGVQRGELDFAIVPRFAGTDGLRLRPFASTPEVLAVGPSTALPDGKTVRVRDLRSLELVMPNPENTRSLTIREYLSANGVELARSLELDTMAGTIDLVARSDWMAILPALLVDGLAKQRGIRAFKLIEPQLTLELVTVEPARRAVPKLAEAFLEMLKAETDSTNRRWQD